MISSSEVGVITPLTSLCMTTRSPTFNWPSGAPRGARSPSGWAAFAHRANKHKYAHDKICEIEFMGDLGCILVITNPVDWTGEHVNTFADTRSINISYTIYSYMFIGKGPEFNGAYPKGAVNQAPVILASC